MPPKKKKRLTTVKEVVKKKKEAAPEEIEREAIVEREKPKGLTQEDLDRALAAGVNVFGRGNIGKISDIDVRAARGEEAVRTAVEEALGKEKGIKEEIEARPEELQKALGIAKKPTDIVGKASVAFNKLFKGDLTGDRLTDAEQKGQNLANLGWKLFSALGQQELFGVKVPAGSTFNNIITQEKQVIMDSRETGNKVLGNVREGLPPEEGLRQVLELQATVSQSYRTAHMASKRSLKAYLEGMGDVESRLLKARTELEGVRAALLTIIATRARQAAAPSFEENRTRAIEGLR